MNSYCSNCGAKRTSSATYCVTCGTQFNAVVDDEASGEILPSTYGRTSGQPRRVLNRIKVIANRVACGIAIAILAVVFLFAIADPRGRLMRGGG